MKNLNSKHRQHKTADFLTSRSGRVLAAVGLAATIVVVRLLPHTGNFTPTLALLMFLGSVFAFSTRWALMVGVVALFITDAVLGFYPGMVTNYAAYILIIAIGGFLQAERWLQVFGGAFASAVIFFLLSNLGVWFSSGLYAHTWQGFVHCFVMAIPFFHLSLVSTLISAVVLYGVYNAALVWLRRTV